MMQMAYQYQAREELDILFVALFLRGHKLDPGLSNQPSLHSTSLTWPAMFTGQLWVGQA